jgi:hypothetical protein
MFIGQKATSVFQKCNPKPPYWSDSDVPSFVERLQSPNDEARAHKIPVIQIFHVEQARMSGNESQTVRRASLGLRS